jgi:hypothetical protein
VQAVLERLRPPAVVRPRPPEPALDLAADADRSGYDPAFLGPTVQHPDLTCGLADAVAPVIGTDDGILPDDAFLFPDHVWVRIVYDFAVAHHLRTIARDHLLRALTPLYLGWVASFVIQMQEADAAAVEARIEELCARYEQDKPYLISRWRWPDRFSP